KAITALLAVAMVAVVAPASAHRYSRTDDGHPLRLIAHVVHPVGILLEYGIFRPVHHFVSECDPFGGNDILFGHKSYIADEGTYHEWTHGDYSPSICDEYEMRERAARQM